MGELIKEQIESIKIDDKSTDTIQADAEKYYTDMVEASKEYIVLLEEDRKEELEEFKDDSEALAKINKDYDAWIEASSKIPTVEEIVKDLEAAQEIQKDFREQALEMIQIAEIKDPKEQDAAVKESMMKKVDLEKDPGAEDRIDAMIKQMREISSNFESKIKEIEKFIKEDVKNVKEVEEEKSNEEVKAQRSGSEKRLINNGAKIQDILSDIDYDTNSQIYG